MGKKILLVLKKYRTLFVILLGIFIGEILGFSNLEIGFIVIVVGFAIALSKEGTERGQLENRVNQLSKIVKGLEDGQNNQIEHLGSKIPSYEEMLGMDDNDFKKWVLIRIEKPYRNKFLKEMSIHEGRTGSFRKTARKETAEGEELILSVFNGDESVIQTLDGVNLADGKTIDLVQEAILAKSASDYSVKNS